MTLSRDITVYPRVSWREHMRMMMRNWDQGDHLLISAPTKAGKTTMMSNLIKRRSHAVVFVSKMKDDTFRREFSGWEIFREWPVSGPRSWQHRILLWPKPVMRNRHQVNLDATNLKFHDIFGSAIDSIVHQGDRAVVIDESLMMNDPKMVNLSNRIAWMHYYGRSAGITMIDLTQRPAWIPRVVLSSVTHAYISETKDAEDAKRLSDLGGIDRREVIDNLQRLPSRHDYVYLNPLGDESPSVVNTRK